MSMLTYINKIEYLYISITMNFSDIKIIFKFHVIYMMIISYDGLMLNLYAQIDISNFVLLIFALQILFYLEQPNKVDR